MTGKSDAVDKVVGLELGADDCLSKPFELRELLARIRSVLRRYRAEGSARAARQEHAVRIFAGWSLDLQFHQLRSPKGIEVELTSTEFNLLRELVRNPHRPLTRDQLLEATQARSWQPYDRSIDVSIGRLRKKIEEDPRHPNLIETVRNAGYVLASGVESKARHDRF